MVRAGSTRGSKRVKRKEKESLMDAAIEETAEVMAGREPAEEPDAVEYVTIRIPVKRIKGMPTVKEQRACWTPRQARAQRLVYDGMHYSGETMRGSKVFTMGTTAPLWHATAWLLDQVADAFDMDPSSLDTLA